MELPKFNRNDVVLLLEPTLATGNTLKMAIRILLDHGIQEGHIIVVSVIASTYGSHSIYHAFPRVTIVTGAIDQKLNDQGFIVPGCGNYGDRYFGTEE